MLVILQDKAQPETQAKAFGDVPFKATLAHETPGALPLVKQPGADGFTLSSSPLFQVLISVFDFQPEQLKCMHQITRLKHRRKTL